MKEHPEIKLEFKFSITEIILEIINPLYKSMDVKPAEFTKKKQKNFNNANLPIIPEGISEATSQSQPPSRLIKVNNATTMAKTDSISPAIDISSEIDIKEIITYSEVRKESI